MNNTPLQLWLCTKEGKPYYQITEFYLLSLPIAQDFPELGFLAVHKTPASQGDTIPASEQWSVTHIDTGMRLSTGCTRNDASTAAQARLLAIGNARVMSGIRAALATRASFDAQQVKAGVISAAHQEAVERAFWEARDVVTVEQ